MNSILDVIVELLINEDFCHNNLNPELERESEEALAALYKWMDERFPGLEENDIAADRIHGAICARERWMLKNGIVIGMRLMMEGMQEASSD